MGKFYQCINLHASTKHPAHTFPKTHPKAHRENQSRSDRQPRSLRRESCTPGNKFPTPAGRCRANAQLEAAERNFAAERGRLLEGLAEAEDGLRSLGKQLERKATEGAELMGCVHASRKYSVPEAPAECR